MTAELMELPRDARLHLSCTRLGTCCHGHQIFICPWELAVLARSAGLGTAEFRTRHTDCGGTRLIFNGPLLVGGPPTHAGKAACSLYDATSGCTVHEGRPLVCRLYPLARGRREGRTIYHHVGSRLPCHDLCPTVSSFPQLSVGQYVASQKLTEAEAAHDAYASLAYGMINAARLIIASPAGIDGAAMRSHFTQLRALPVAERAGHIPPAWLDCLTIPVLASALENPAAYVAEHGQQLAARLQHEFGTSQASDALIQAVRLYLVMGLHLGTAVGTDPDVMSQLLAAT